MLAKVALILSKTVLNVCIILYFKPITTPSDYAFNIIIISIIIKVRKTF